MNPNLCLRSFFYSEIDKENIFTFRGVFTLAFFSAHKEIIDEAFVWKIFYQVVQALIHCHSRSTLCQVILHRDVKPANIFLDRENNAKLGDFGVSNKLEYCEYSTGSLAGTELYYSPVSLVIITHTLFLLIFLTGHLSSWDSGVKFLTSKMLQFACDYILVRCFI